jgi:hypothetical protein
MDIRDPFLTQLPDEFQEFIHPLRFHAVMGPSLPSMTMGTLFVPGLQLHGFTFLPRNLFRKSTIADRSL